MSYEANTHKHQMIILRTLLLQPDAGFAELQKRMQVESDAANFHIKQLMHAGYADKNNEGRYTLTRRGKEYANRMDTDQHVIEKQPKLSVVLIIENDDGKILAQQRLKQPYYGYWGRPTGKIGWGEKITEAAARELLEETGLTAELEMKGLYHKIDIVKGSGELLEDKYFCLVYGKQPSGELIAEDEGHHNAWLTHEELLKKDKVFQSMKEISEPARGRTFGYIEEVCAYDPADY